MKINIKNLTCQNKRIRLVPKQEDSIFDLLESELPVDYLNEDDMVSFCLGVADGCSNIPPFNPNDIFGTPDSSCFFPLKDLAREGNTLEESLEGLQNTNVLLYLKNTNESDTTIRISKMEGLGRFEEAGTFINNPTIFVTPVLFQACLRGNTCVPGIIDFSGAIILDDEIFGRITSPFMSEKDYFSAEQLISKLSDVNIEMTELFEWIEPEEEIEIPCEDAIQKAVLAQYNQTSESFYFSYDITVNGYTVRDIVGNLFSNVLDEFFSIAYQNGPQDIAQYLDFYSDSSGNIYISNNSSSEYFKFIIKTNAMVDGGELPIPINEWLRSSSYNENVTVDHNADTGIITFCLAPRQPLSYIGFTGWFGEGWKGINKYAIEVNGVLYEDPRTVETADGAWFIGTLQDVLSYNEEALSMFGTYFGSDGGGEFYLTQPGRYDIRFIKQDPTGDYEDYINSNIPEYSYGEYPTIDMNGNWSFTLYASESDFENEEVILE